MTRRKVTSRKPLEALAACPSRSRRPPAPTLASFLALLLCLVVPILRAEVAESWIEETIFRLEDMKGEERRETLQKACGLNDKRLAGALARALLAEVAEDSDAIRDRIAETLCKTADASNMETVAKICESEDLGGKERGLKIMGHLRTPEAIEFLKERARLSFGTEKSAAIGGLGYTGEKALIPYLGKVLKESGSDEQAAARMSLARLGVNEVIPALLQDYERTHREREQLDFESKRVERLPDGREKTRAFKRIKEKQQRVFRNLREQRRFFLDIPSSAIPFFVQAANGEGLSFSYSLILENLGRMANAENASLFVGLLHNQHALIRMRALDILGKYPTTASQEEVRKILQEQLAADDWHLRLTAVENLNWLPEAERNAGILKCLDEPSRAVRIAAVRQAGKYQVEEAAPKIRQMLQSAADVDLAVACKDAIAALGDD